MAHAAQTSHRRGGAAHASHRSAPSDGPIRTLTWLGLTFAMILGLVLSGRDHVGVRAGALTLLIMLIPVTLGVFVTAFRRGFGSGAAAFLTAAAFALVALKFLF
ncbi:hypothetical protein FB561_2643 [Kribbella amoyensis]|uniref:Uncharacterized protein n=1 Tax=Kribbella amoyensis TaxID=996641 RepID=A0A561BRK0_9ACTN|nr:hypothetical protein [Kribbella amoyensis]TWD81527.1 hypothetical protein FB561_2643 [Kribbella amoyensis]